MAPHDRWRGCACGLKQNHVSFEFCLPTNAIKVPAGPEWLHEIKHDGFRIRVERDGDRVRLITRGGYDWTKRYPWIAESALKNRIKQFVIDGEAVKSPADTLHKNPPPIGQRGVPIKVCQLKKKIS